MVVTGGGWLVAPSGTSGAGMTPLRIPAVIPANAGIQRHTDRPGRCLAAPAIISLIAGGLQAAAEECGLLLAVDLDTVAAGFYYEEAVVGVYRYRYCAPE